MTPTRRQFVVAATSVAAYSSITKARLRRQSAGVTHAGVDPWIEVDRTALEHNVREVNRLTSGRPVLAVVKNNAYGLGLEYACPVLEAMPEIAGFAVVKTDAALKLRQIGITKPVLHMGLFSIDEVRELANAQIQLSLFTDDVLERLRPLTRRNERASAHVYVDTGMGRMGIPYHRTLDWLASLASSPAIQIRGTFTAFTEDSDFDHEQLRRFTALAEDVRRRGLDTGLLHAASSNGVFHLPAAHLDLVRPGIALYGAYPSRPEEERSMSRLRCAVRLNARVARVERLRVGDSVSYGRNYVADKPTWVATIPAGHSDGYTRDAVRGARVHIGGRTYPVIGAVSASHTIVEIGAEKTVELGDVATLLGPDASVIEPNNVAAASGASVYDLLMHLNPDIPRVLVG